MLTTATLSGFGCRKNEFHNKIMVSGDPPPMVKDHTFLFFSGPFPKKLKQCVSHVVQFVFFFLCLMEAKATFVFFFFLIST